MSDSWVGFRPSPKPDNSRPTAKRSFEATSNLLIAKVLKLLTTQVGVESWLVRFTKFDPRLGARLKFTVNEENYGGTYARIDIPRRVILLTELHGELDFRLTEKQNGTDIILNCTKTLTDAEKPEWEKLVQDCFSRFEKVLSHAS
ncbi:unannotated protein [freshwater metagenome]|uniref:Unannotated protein n=1 Tax=freshwater metagenome TaxID=449393 RepID=A0A6J6J7D4_9ZZZZ|nr:hypothetical protein [Actinomycetota bacterium]